MIKNNNPIPIKVLGLDKRNIDSLKTSNILTINELIILSEKELYELPNISSYIINILIKKLQFLGFDFNIKSLTINDDICYFNINKNIINKLKSKDINSIKELINNKELKNILNEKEYNEILENLQQNGIKNVGIDLSLINENTTLEELIKIINLSNSSYLILRRNGFNTIKDLISINKRDLLNIGYLGENKYNEIVDKLHFLGFKFKNEIKNNIVRR